MSFKRLCLWAAMSGEATSRVYSPERRLVCALLWRAYTDCLVEYYGGGKVPGTGKKFKESAYDWLFNLNEEEENNANYFCIAADMEWELAQVQQAVKAGGEMPKRRFVYGK